MANAGSASTGAPLSAASGPASSASASSSGPGSASTSASASAVSIPPSSASVESSLPVSSSSASSTSSFTPSSTLSSTTHASSMILTAPSTTIARSTMIGTSNGQTFTTIVEITSTISPGSTVAASTSTPQSASHTGAIVGGVIGGLAFLGLVGGVLFWFHRRSRDKTDFDGNFDPARVTSTGPIPSDPEMIQHHVGGGTLPQMDLDDEDDGMGGRLPNSIVGGGIVTPFAYTPTASAYGSTRSRSPPASSGSPPPMSQHSQDGYASTMSSAGGYYAAVPQQLQAVGGYYPPGPPSSSSSSGIQHMPRSAKEQEAGRSGNFAVANPSTEAGDSRPISGPYNDQYQAYLRSGPQARRGSQSEYNDTSSYPPLPPAASSSGASQRAGGVLVHQDGGRVEPETVLEEEADEIPPTYDSLPNEERK
ncbi:hypothetical protein B0H12DRAFT_1126638 [Mycena haematopus]|nr:hypothetical protein B0H12DRAFT_1126638 [Mycena haematopus]